MHCFNLPQELIPGLIKNPELQGCRALVVGVALPAAAGGARTLGSSDHPHFQKGAHRSVTGWPGPSRKVTGHCFTGANIPLQGCRPGKPFFCSGVGLSWVFRKECDLITFQLQKLPGHTAPASAGGPPPSCWHPTEPAGVWVFFVNVKEIPTLSVQGKKAKTAPLQDTPPPSS